MKKCLWFLAVAAFALLFAVPGQAWQGRMAGMGDVYGLVQDESDYLTHPADIASGKGVNFYGDFRYTRDETTNWEYNSSGSILGILFFSYPYDITGSTDTYEGRVGVAFPAGAGRMGIFFEYLGERGKFDGDQAALVVAPPLGYTSYDMKKDLDNFNFRLMYGLPLGDVKAGAEIQIAHKVEKINENSYSADGVWHQNNLASGVEPYSSLYPFMVPYDSKYWEVLGKLSVEGMVGTAKYTLTLKGGAPFSSNNSYDYAYRDGGDVETGSLDGTVEGWNLGGEFWVRFPLQDNLSLPFVLRGGYKETIRDGSGIVGDFYIPRLPYMSFTPYDYEHQTKDGFIEVGGGFDYTPCKGSKVAGGLYYTYSDFAQNITVTTDGTFPLNYGDYPETTEHRITLKLAAEREFSPTVALRGGFNAYYGWVKSNYSVDELFGIADQIEATGDGNHWGLGASLGLTFKAGSVSIEPFINGGYSKIDIDGDVSRQVLFNGDTNYKKADWFIGAGFSLRF